MSKEKLINNMVDANKIKKEKVLIDKYCSAWNELDKTKRRNQLQEVWEVDGKYIDPRSNLNGIEELVNHIGKIQSGRPGTKIIRTSEIDLHHNIGRFNWQLVKEDHTILIKGIDIVFFNEGVTKIEKMIGFFGELA